MCTRQVFKNGLRALNKWTRDVDCWTWCLKSCSVVSDRQLRRWVSGFQAQHAYVAQVWNKKCIAISDMSTIPSSASLWRTIGRNSSSRGVAGHSTTTSVSSSSFGSGSGGGVAGAVSSTIVLNFFSSLCLCSSRRWRHSAMSRWSAKNCSTNVYFKALWSEPSIMAFDHLFEYLHGRTLPKSTEMGRISCSEGAVP